MDYPINFTGHRRQWVNVGAYRFAVRAFIPRIAYALTLIHRHHEPPDSDTPEAQALHAEVAAMARENDWDKYRRHAGIGTWTLAGLIFILPKVGPLKLVDVKGPTQRHRGGLRPQRSCFCGGIPPCPAPLYAHRRAGSRIVPGHAVAS